MTLVLSLDRALVPVWTLAALAAGALGTGSRRILAAIDASMGEVYSGAFELRDGGLAALSNESACAPDVVALPAGDDHWQGRGTGFAAADGAVQARLWRSPAIAAATRLAPTPPGARRTAPPPRTPAPGDGQGHAK